MTRGTFPTLLAHPPRILLGMTRLDLAVLGASYFLLSFFKVSGITQLVTMAGGLFLLKYAQRKLPRGFFRFITSPRQLKWSYFLEKKL